MEKPGKARAWHEIVHEELTRADVRLVTYVPDNVLSPLIRSLHDDDHFTTFCTAREEEAVGIVAGAWMGGMLGVVLMQTSGFATLPNVLASLAVPYQIPLLMIISERGTLGEFNLGQAMVCRTMRPALDSLGIEHHTIRRRLRGRADHPAGSDHPGAGGADPQSAAHRRQDRTEGEAVMTTSGTSSRRGEAKVMSRADLTARLVAKLPAEEAIVAGIGFTNFELWSVGRRPQNFYMLGSMGLALPIALGVAIAQPARRVIALEGDGSLLMQLGVLGTIASRRPKNLVMIVWDDGAYRITGGQPTATAGAVDLVGVARAAGIASSRWATNEAHFEQLVDEALAADAPTFIAARVTGDRPAATTHRDPVQIRESFMRGLGVRRDPFSA
jgi:thiamine pyrophosphate-dependent acetolactate synthase large subunit-like protein